MHDIKIAHCNLKFNYIIVDPIDVLKVVDKAYTHIKLHDFGISKVEVKKNLEVLKK